MTPYSDIYERFFHRIEEDRDFFDYYKLPEVDMLAVATKRANAYMEEAVSRILIYCLPQIDFSKRTGDDSGFAETLTPGEIYLIASLMFEQYMERDIAYLKRLSVNYTSKELNVFSPDNWRNSFQAMFENVQHKNAELIDRYKNTDRLTGQFRSINFAAYDTES